MQDDQTMNTESPATLAMTDAHAQHVAAGGRRITLEFAPAEWERLRGGAYFQRTDMTPEEFARAAIVEAVDRSLASSGAVIRSSSFIPQPSSLSQ